MTTGSNVTSDAPTAGTAWRSRFVWYDLLTTDIAAAAAFYTQVVGWGTQEYDMGPGGKYLMWTAGDVPIGGVVVLPSETKGIPPHWMAHVSVANVDDSVHQVIALGGEVITPAMDIPTVGRYAVIADPQGAAIALFTPNQGPRPDDFSPKVGEFSWHELMTSDHTAGFAFYSKIFGWHKQGAEDMGPPVGEYLLFGPTDATAGAGQHTGAYGGMFTLSPEMPMPPSWLYYIRVPSVDAAVEKVNALGGQVMNGPMDVPGGDRIAQCTDLVGAAFAVHSVKG